VAGRPAVAIEPDERPDPRKERLAALFDSYEDRLYGLARRLTSNPEDASDLVQETFLRAARSSTSVPLSAPDDEAWLVRVLINIRRDQWRKSKVRERYRAFDMNLVSTESDPESALGAKKLIWNALDVLPPRRRAVLILHELEGKRIPEIATLLGVTAITVRWHLSVGRRQLSQVLRLGDTR
jgi:RNA polymerase sigma-70 factor (ECF subfamily)